MNIVYSLLSILALNYYFFDIKDIIGFNTIFNIPLFFVFLTYFKKTKPRNARMKKFIIPLAAVFSITTVLGKAIQMDDTLNFYFKSFWMLLVGLLMLAGFYFVYYLIFTSVFNFFEKKKEIARINNIDSSPIIL